MLLILWFLIMGMITSLIYCDTALNVYLLAGILLLIRSFPQVLFIILGLEFISLSVIVMAIILLLFSHSSMELVYLVMGSLVLEASIGLSLLVSSVRFRAKLKDLMK